jgi:hypothetical protein
MARILIFLITFNLKIYWEITCCYLKLINRVFFKEILNDATAVENIYNVVARIYLLVLMQINDLTRRFKYFMLMRSCDHAQFQCDHAQADTLK